MEKKFFTRVDPNVLILKGVDQVFKPVSAKLILNQQAEMRETSEGFEFCNPYDPIEKSIVWYVLECEYESAIHSNLKIHVRFFLGGDDDLASITDADNFISPMKLIRKHILNIDYDEYVYLVETLNNVKDEKITVYLTLYVDLSELDDIEEMDDDDFELDEYRYAGYVIDTDKSYRNTEDRGGHGYYVCKNDKLKPVKDIIRKK